MAQLDQHPINFPWQMFLQAQEMKNQNQQDMYKNIQGIGTNLGSIGQTLEKEKAKSVLASALASMRTGQIPEMEAPDATGGISSGPNQNYTPQVQAPPQQAQMGGLTPEATQALMTLSPDIGTKLAGQQLDPLVQSQIYENYSKGNQNRIAAKSMQEVYRTADGKMTTTKTPGAVLIGTVPLTEAFQYNQAGQLAEARQGFASQKELNKQWNDLQKTVNPFRSQGIGGSASTFNKAAVANQAAARGLKILNKPSLTWQELNAYVNTDIASIQRGGTPTDIQLHESNYKTLAGKLGSFNTFLTGKPSTGLVPPETRNQIRQNIMDIIDVDNQIIDDGIDYAEQAYPDAVKAFPQRWDRIKQQAVKIKAVGQDTKLGGDRGVDSLFDQVGAP